MGPIRTIERTIKLRRKAQCSFKVQGQDLQVRKIESNLNIGGSWLDRVLVVLVGQVGFFASHPGFGHWKDSGYDLMCFLETTIETY